MERALSAALQDCGWLRPEHRIGDPNGYMRHVLYVDPRDRFVVSAITWLPGQQSAVHGHQVWCAFGVAEGELTEEQFTPSLERVKTAVVRPGELADGDFECKLVHRVSNCTAAPLVSLHLYGVGAARLTTGINRPY